jgi:hypothetical protein
VTSSAVPTDRAQDSQNTADSDQPAPSMRKPANAGPVAIPIADEAPNTPMIVPSRRRGATSRIPASITPVFPSWNPMSNMLRPSCQGSCERATPAKTTASTRALRTMTALRLYLSAHTPHRGTSGRPTRKISELKSPMNASRSSSGTPISSRYVGSRAKIWLMPRLSTIEVTQKTATRTRQSCVGRVGVADIRAG